MDSLTPRLINAPLLIGLCQLAGARLVADQGKLLYFPAAEDAPMPFRALLRAALNQANQLKPDVLLLLARPDHERDAVVSAALLREGFWNPQGRCDFFIGRLDNSHTCKRCGHPVRAHGTFETVLAYREAKMT